MLLARLGERPQAFDEFAAARQVFAKLGAQNDLALIRQSMDQLHMSGAEAV
jgi:hypothetical protein